MNYYLLNPTGNITVLVDGDCPPDEIMKREPSCEQVGYIYEKDGCDIALRMAGGEFCGNATMCAAFMTGKKNVSVYVEGTGIVKAEIDGNTGHVSMPKPYEITDYKGYPMVRFKGMDHVIVRDNLNPDLIKQWCIGEAMGFMYLEGDNLKPLVYVKSINTLFWENSCASGTTAVGEYLKYPVSLKQPGGTLSYSDGILTGRVELIKKVTL